MGDVLQKGLNEEPDSRREPTRRGLLDRLGLKNNSYRVEGPFGGEEGDIPVDFGSAENQIYSDDDTLGESDFGAMKGVKCQIPIFDAQTTSWRRFKMEFIIAMRHFRLVDSVLDGEKEEACRGQDDFS